MPPAFCQPVPIKFYIYSFDKGLTAGKKTDILYCLGIIYRVRDSPVNVRINNVYYKER